MLTATAILAALVLLTASDSTEPATAPGQTGRDFDQPDSR